MAERYSRVFSLPTARYAPDCPVVLAAGALLKDNLTGGILAQLKFENISAKPIIGLKVQVMPFDLAGQPLHSATQSYLDMTIPYGTQFGQKIGIPISDPSARSCEVTVIQVIFRF